MGLYIKEHADTIDNCRFCWMCRHVCTQGKATSNEIHTARALGLLLASINKGANDYNSRTAEILFQCCQCGYCKEWCVSSYDVPSFVRAGRADAVKAGFVPGTVKTVIESLDAYGQPFSPALKVEDELSCKINEINNNNSCSETLLYLGSFARYLRPEVAKAAISLLGKLDISFNVMENEPDSGHYYYNLGFIQKGEAQSVKLVGAFKDKGYKTIGVLSPADYYTIANEYNNELLKGTGIKIVPIISLISTFDIKPAKTLNCLKTAYNDSSYLARYLGITDEPHKVLKAIFGQNLHELHWSGKLAKSSGSELLLTYPEMALNIAKFMLKEVIEGNVSTLVVSGAESKESLLRAIKCGDSSQKCEKCGDSPEVIELLELIDGVL